jgi:hypothetical protein
MNSRKDAVMRFSIRDMMWMTAVIAVAIGWYLDHYSAQRARDKSLKIMSEYMENWMKYDHSDAPLFVSPTLHNQHDTKSSSAE